MSESNPGPRPDRNHARHLRRALELAREYSTDGVHGPFGAVVVRDDEVVGEGWNRVVAGNDPTAHAEVVALREAARRLGTHDLSGCVLYASCEPCPMCLAATYWARIGEVHFAASSSDAAEIGFDDARLYEELAQPWAARSIRAHQALRTAGQRVLREWSDNPDHVDY